MIIGIGGISNAGKSSLARKIKEHFSEQSVKILCQDDFAKPTDQIPKIKDHVNWETPESIDFDKYFHNLVLEKSRNDIVIDEGLFVKYDKRINRLHDKIIFMSLLRSEFVQRKKADMRWGREPDWYIDHIWDAHHEFLKSINLLPNELRLNSDQKVDFSSVVDYLHQ